MNVNDACRMMARTIASEIGPWGGQCAFFGGLIPGMLVTNIGEEVAPHIGTRDVDLAIRVAALEDTQEAYRTLKHNLTNIGLTQRSNRSFEWYRNVNGFDMIVELFVPVEDPAQGGKLQKKPVDNSGSGLTALGIYGLDLIGCDIVTVEDEGHLLDNRGIKKVRLRVCGPAMLLSLKAWALHDRNKPKDGYDVVWMLRTLGANVIADRFRDAKLFNTDFGRSALNFLSDAFATHEHSGPMGWVSESFFSGEEAAREARTATGLVREFVQLCS